MRRSIAVLFLGLAGCVQLELGSPPPKVRASMEGVVRCWFGYDPTKGALIDSCLFRRSSDGQPFVDLYVWDSKPEDGACAKGAVTWRNKNLKHPYVYDPVSGTINCNASWEGGVYDPHDPALYEFEWVDAAVWVDGDKATYLGRHAF